MTAYGCEKTSFKKLLFEFCQACNDFGERLWCSGAADFVYAHGQGGEVRKMMFQPVNSDAFLHLDLIKKRIVSLKFNALYDVKLHIACAFF